MDNDLIGQAFQELASQEGGLVGNFIGLAEVHSPEDPDSTQYILVRHGSPAVVLGLHEYLGMVLRDSVQENMQDG